MNSNLFDFIGNNTGPWKVVSMNTITGDSLGPVSHLTIRPGSLAKPTEGLWSLKGVISNLRYTERAEKDQLTAIQADLGRPEATCAALIPIRKSEAWWVLTQGERRNLFDTQSHHTPVGMEYLPAVARKLYHCRDIAEPFDFLTWFEYAPAHSNAFEELVARLRQTEEWKYVDREIDIRLVRENK